MTPASTKYRDRRPRMAKMLEVNTMNGSVVMASTAGTESTANTTSVDSITASTSRSGVAIHPPHQLEDGVPLGMDLLIPLERHMHAGEDQERPEQVHDPVERVDQHHAGGDHEGPRSEEH